MAIRWQFGFGPRGRHRRADAGRTKFPLKSRVGGGRGIRTPDRTFGSYNGLANRRLQPLGHPSGIPSPASAPGWVDPLIATFLAKVQWLVKSLHLSAYAMRSCWKKIPRVVVQGRLTRRRSKEDCSCQPSTLPTGWRSVSHGGHRRSNQSDQAWLTPRIPGREPA